MRLPTYVICLSLCAACQNYGLRDKLETPGAFLNSGPAIKEGLYAFWNLNGSLADSWDNGTGAQNGTGTGILFTADRQGRANQAVSMPAGAALDFGYDPAYATTPFTLCLWYRLHTAATLEVLRFSAAPNGYSLQVRDTAIGFDLFVQNTGIISDGAPRQAGVWYYSCIAIDSQANVYDGQFGGSLTATPGAGHSLTIPGAGTFLSLQPGATGVDFDDVVFYSRKLSLAEATANFFSSQQ